MLQTHVVYNLFLVFVIVYLVFPPIKIINYFSFARLLIMAASTTSRINTIDLITYLWTFLCFKIMAITVQNFFMPGKFSSSIIYSSCNSLIFPLQQTTSKRSGLHKDSNSFCSQICNSSKAVLAGKIE